MTNKQIESLGWKGIITGRDDNMTPITDRFIIHNSKTSANGDKLDQVYTLSRSVFNPEWYTITVKQGFNEKEVYDDKLFQGILKDENELEWVMERCGVKKQTGKENN